MGDVKLCESGSTSAEFFTMAKKQKDTYRPVGEMEKVDKKFIFVKVNSADIVPANNGRAFKVTSNVALLPKHKQYRDEFFN